MRQDVIKADPWPKTFAWMQEDENGGGQQLLSAHNKWEAYNPADRHRGQVLKKDLVNKCRPIISTATTPIQCEAYVSGSGTTNVVYTNVIYRMAAQYSSMLNVKVASSVPLTNERPRWRQSFAKACLVHVYFQLQGLPSITRSTFNYKVLV